MEANVWKPDVDTTWTNDRLMNIWDFEFIGLSTAITEDCFIQVESFSSKERSLSTASEQRDHLQNECGNVEPSEVCQHRWDLHVCSTKQLRSCKWSALTLEVFVLEERWLGDLGGNYIFCSGRTCRWATSTCRTWLKCLGHLDSFTCQDKTGINSKV